MPKWEVVEEPQPVTAPLRSPADPQHNATAPPDPFEPQPEPFTKPDSIKDAAHWTLVPFAVVGALLSTAGVVYFLRDSPIIGVVLLVAGLLTIVGAITYVQCQIQDVCEWCGEWQAVERTGVPHE